MKKQLVPIMLALTACLACGQGTFQYDQQTSTNSPGVKVAYSVADTVGQSFIPSLSSIGFAQFWVDDPNPSGAGVTTYVNLWSGSIGNGTLLGSTASVFVPVLSNSPMNYFFSTPITLTSGATYYLQLVNAAGDDLYAGVAGVPYSSGSAFINGNAQSFDLWFGEGTVVPEPSFITLALLGIAALFTAARRRS